MSDPVDREECYNMHFYCKKEDCKGFEQCTIQAMVEMGRVPND